jgi:hypothetical protein
MCGFVAAFCAWMGGGSALFILAAYVLVGNVGILAGAALSLFLRRTPRAEELGQLHPAE